MENTQAKCKCHNKCCTLIVHKVVLSNFPPLVNGSYSYIQYLTRSYLFIQLLVCLCSEQFITCDIIQARGTCPPEGAPDREHPNITKPAPSRLLIGQCGT